MAVLVQRFANRERAQIQAIMIACSALTSEARARTLHLDLEPHRSLSGLQGKIMSRTTRKQAEWTLHRAVDVLVAEGRYPVATDEIVVQSVEERIGSNAAFSPPARLEGAQPGA
jgi:hypothetical protein